MKSKLLSVLLLLISLNFLGCSSISSNKTKSPGSFHVDWARSTTAVSENKNYLGAKQPHLMSPVVSKNLVFVGNGIDGITAFTKHNGQKVWRREISGGISSEATLVADRLFFSSNDGFFYSLSKNTGAIVWQKKLPSSSYGKPLVKSGRVFFVTSNNTLYALDAIDGKRVWTYHRNQTTGLSIRGSSSPVMSGKTLYLGMNDGYFVAVNSIDGKMIWEKSLINDSASSNQLPDLDADPVIYNNKIYVSNYSDALYCLDTENGNVLWQHNKGSHVSVTIASLLGAEKTNPTLFYSTSSGEIISLEPDTGKVKWEKKTLSGIGTKVIHKLSGHEDLLFYGESNGAIKAILAKSGIEKSEFIPGKGLIANPTVTEKNNIYFISNQGYIYALKWL